MTPSLSTWCCSSHPRGRARLARDPAPRTGTPAQPFTELDQDRGLVGMPAQVVASAQRYADAGVAHILARIGLQDIPIEHALRSVEPLGNSVLPALR